MSNNYRISIIGSGNVAFHLSQALEKAGHVIEEVYSRNLAHAKLLASKLYNANATENLNFSSSRSRIFIIAVSDQAIETIAGKIVLPSGSLLAHTSGSTPISALNNFENIAVFYPLQTFSKKRKINFPEIPLCLEASNEHAWNVFESLAISMGCKVQEMDSEERKVVHLSAVFACNFTNHLFGIASYILQSQELSPALLHPIIAETVNKALENDPFTVQTGPATRKDDEVINTHLEMLEDVPMYKQIYEAITKSIIDQGA